MLSGSDFILFVFMKEPVVVSQIAFNYTSHKYQNGFENLLLHIAVCVYYLELFYMEMLCR